MQIEISLSFHLKPLRILKIKPKVAAYATKYGEKKEHSSIADVIAKLHNNFENQSAVSAENCEQF